MISNSKPLWERVLKSGLLSLVLIMGALSICGDLYIRFHYAAVMPRAPQSETGRIYPVPAQYGGTVYVNQLEFKRREFVRYEMTYMFGGVLLLYACVGTRMKWWPVTLRAKSRNAQ